LPDNFIDLAEQITDPVRRDVTNRQKKRIRSSEIGLNTENKRLMTQASVTCDDDDEVVMEEDVDFAPFVANSAKDSSNSSCAPGSRNEVIESSHEVMDLNIQVSNEILNHTLSPSAPHK
jgi:hypothetical protein